MSPEELERVWVPEWDPDWELLGPEVERRCRFKGCGERAVARMNRGLTRNGYLRELWWHYCPDHLYGRRISDGVLEVRVSADSEMARG